MRNKRRLLRYGFATVELGIAVGVILLSGCGISTATLATAPAPAAQLQMQGNVHGGQQPVSGSTIQIYATNATGYGALSYSLLTAPVFTNSYGDFTIDGDYTCPSANAMVYITATGGNPGTGANNPNLALMAALGPCGNLSTSTFINMNELTTVASVYALAPFMTDYNAVGTSPNNALGLSNAFATVNKLVNVATGSVPGTTLPAGSTVPTTEMNTLADILATCVNSNGGTAGDNTSCGTLFSYTTPSGGPAPTNTITAAINIAKHPGKNVSPLVYLVLPTAPYQPTLTSASDLTISIKYAPPNLINAPSAAALDASGNLWVTNAGNNTLGVLSPSGGTPTIYSGGGLSTPSGIAFDASGDAWVTDKGSSKLSVFTAAGTGTQTPVTGLSAPTAVAIDGVGTIWVTNSGSNSLTAVTATGTTANTWTNYTAGGINTPLAVAINPQ